IQRVLRGRDSTPSSPSFARRKQIWHTPALPVTPRKILSKPGITSLIVFPNPNFTLSRKLISGQLFCLHGHSELLLLPLLDFAVEIPARLLQILNVIGVAIRG